MKFIVIGLGNFGAALSKKLVHLGHEVIGADARMELVERLKDELTHTITLDAAKPEAVESLPLRDVDAVINAIGENEGANIMLSAILKQLAVKRIICRVITPLQKTVLEAMNIREFVHPEEDSAERMAYTLDLAAVTDSYRINEQYQIIEVQLPERYIDHRVGEIDFSGKYGILPVTMIRTIEERSMLGSPHTVKSVTGLLSPDTLMRRGDRLLLFGEVSRLEDFIEE